MRPPIKEVDRRPPAVAVMGHADVRPLRRPDVAELVAAQLREATDRVAAARIDYYRARVLPDGHVIGRAKIAVSLVDGVPEADVPASC